MNVYNVGDRTETIMKLSTNSQGSQEKTPEEIEEAFRLIEDLKFFLATAPVNWQENQVIRRYYLNNDQGFASCVFWNNLFYITGTDVVKCCVYRMQQFGREIVQKKKFEEGIFSDLRHLKCGIDATLEQPKSEFLSFLFRNMCLKTQKKQKVFFWFSVPHDKIFTDALERDLKREASNQPSTTRAIKEPAISFNLDVSSELSLYDQLKSHFNSRIPQPEPIMDIDDTENIIENNINIIDDKKEEVEFQDEINLADTSQIKEDLAINTSTSVMFNQHMELLDDVSITNNKENDKYSTKDAEITQQTLVLSQDDSLNDHSVQEQQYEKADLINSLVEIDDHDFPLDYIPVEIEYPNQEEGSVYNLNNLSPDVIQQKYLLYDNNMNNYNSMNHFEDEFNAMNNGLPYSSTVPLTASQPVFPMIWPMTAAGKPPFMASNNYYFQNRRESNYSDNEKKHNDNDDNDDNENENKTNEDFEKLSEDSNNQSGDSINGKKGSNEIKRGSSIDSSKVTSNEGENVVNDSKANKNSSSSNNENTDANSNNECENNTQKPMSDLDEQFQPYKMYPNVYPMQLPYMNGMIPPNMQMGMMGGYPFDMPLMVPENGTLYQQNDFAQPNDTALEENYFPQMDPYSWYYGMPPPRQPTSGFYSKMHSTPIVQQNGIASRNGYIQTISSPWNSQPQPPQQYHKNMNTKGYSGNQRSSKVTPGERWRHFQGVSQSNPGNKFVFSKVNNISKPAHGLSSRRQQNSASTIKIKQTFTTSDSGRDDHINDEVSKTKVRNNSSAVPHITKAASSSNMDNE